MSAIAVAGIAWPLRVHRAAVTAILPAMDQSETQIIAAVLGGATDRYAELVNRYQGPAFRLALSLLGYEEDAKDAAQEAFVSAYRNLGRFHGRAKFSTWLYRIVVNECTDLIRRRVRAPATVPLGASDPDEAEIPIFVDVADPSADPNRDAVNRELSARLSRAIRQLPDKQRQAFVLHHVHGAALADVSEIMGCRLGTVKAHIFRAAATLRAQLSPWMNEEVA